MRHKGGIFSSLTLKRAIALAACAVLLYYAVGGAYLHQHKIGDETPCHICHTLQTPTLAASPQALLSAPLFIAWNLPPAENVAPTAVFSPQYAGRAPPSL
jgi:hypothetical protein